MKTASKIRRKELLQSVLALSIACLATGVEGSEHCDSEGTTHYIMNNRIWEGNGCGVELARIFDGSAVWGGDGQVETCYQTYRTDTPVFTIDYLKNSTAGGRVLILMTHGTPRNIPDHSGEPLMDVFLTQTARDLAFDAYAIAGYVPYVHIDYSDIGVGTGPPVPCIWLMRGGIEFHFKSGHFESDAIVHGNYCYSADAWDSWVGSGITSFTGYLDEAFVSEACSDLEKIQSRMGCFSWNYGLGYESTVESAVQSLAGEVVFRGDGTNSYDCTRNCLDLAIPPDDNPAVWITDFSASNGAISWSSAVENGTTGYRLLGWSDNAWEVLEPYVAANGSGSSYAVQLKSDWERIAIQEIEQVADSLRINDVCWTPVRSSVADVSLSNETRSLSRHTRMEKSAEWKGNIRRQRKEALSQEEEIAKSSMLNKDATGATSLPKAKRASTGTMAVLLIAPDLGVGTAEALSAYKDEMIWNGIPDEDIRTYILPSPYDSTTLADQVITSPEEYIVIFGSVNHRNLGETMTPLPWILDPNMAHIWTFEGDDNDALSLWDFEKSQTSDRVGKAVGIVPIRDLDDIYNYADKQMICYQTLTYGYDRQISLWGDDYAHGSENSTEAVQATIRGTAMRLGEHWLVDTLWASQFPPSSPYLEEEALGMMAQGRHVIGMASTYTNAHWYGSFLSDDELIESTLEYTDVVSHMLSLSCHANELDYWGSSSGGFCQNCIVPELMVTQDGGSVSSIGPTTGFLQPYYYKYMQKFFEILEDVYESEDEYIRIGDLHRATRNALIDEYPNDTLMVHFAMVNMLVGDPTLPVYNAPPNPWVGVEGDRPEAWEGARRTLRVQPNPFNPFTSIAFDVGRRGFATVAVYDVSGRRVRTVFSGPVQPGTYEVEWEGRSDGGGEVSSGVYFLRLVLNGRSTVKKVSLVR